MNWKRLPPRPDLMNAQPQSRFDLVVNGMRFRIVRMHKTKQTGYFFKWNTQSVPGWSEAITCKVFKNRISSQQELFRQSQRAGFRVDI